MPRMVPVLIALVLCAVGALTLAAAEQEPVPSRYDADADGRIEFREFEQAVHDYYDGDNGLTQADIVDLDFRFLFDIPVETPTPATPTPVPLPTETPPPNLTLTPIPPPSDALLECPTYKSGVAGPNPWDDHEEQQLARYGRGHDVDVVFINPDADQWEYGIVVRSQRYQFVNELGDWILVSNYLFNDGVPHPLDTVEAGSLGESFNAGAGARNRFTQKLEERSDGKLVPVWRVNGVKVPAPDDGIEGIHHFGWRGANWGYSQMLWASEETEYEGLCTVRRPGKEDDDA